MNEEKKAVTLLDVLENSALRYGERAAFIYRAGKEDRTVTYRALLDDVMRLSAALSGKGVRAGSKVLLLSDNRYEWILSDLALVALRAISVPRGADTPAQEIEFIINHSGCEFAVIEKGDMLEGNRDLLARLTGVFCMEGVAGEGPTKDLYYYRDIIRESGGPAGEITGKEGLSKDDAFTIIYTSGTTGTPKGVVLTHRNIMHQIENLPDIIALSEEDRWLSILPTWHIFERTAEYIAISRGCTTAYSTLKTFAQDLEKYRPTIVATVPRLWESLYLKVVSAIRKQGRRKARLFSALTGISASFRRNRRLLLGRLPRFERDSPVRALPEKFLAAVKMGLLFLPYLFARKKLSAVKGKFGGRLRMAISGGGSLPGYLDEWIDAVGIRIVNAYGMTECAPGIAGRGVDCEIFGTLGPPMPGTKIRIVDESGSEVPPGVEGEVLVSGDQVTPGYYDNPEENEKSFTKDGYLKTGDLGRFTLGGELVLTGRSKEIIVLASGENIDPSRIEGAITELPYVKDAVLVGQDRKGLGALVIPDIDRMKEYLTAGFSHLVQETEEFLHDKRIVEWVRAEMNKLLHPRRGFKPYERLHRIGFLEKEFKLGEELTNTLKKKRRYIEQKYMEVINRIFGDEGK